MNKDLGELRAEIRQTTKAVLSMQAEEEGLMEDIAIRLKKINQKADILLEYGPLIIKEW